MNDRKKSNGSERKVIRPKVDGHGLMVVIGGR